MSDRVEVPQALVEAMTRGECVLFAGHKVSELAGYLSWTELLHGLAQQLGTPGNVLGQMAYSNDNTREQLADLISLRLGERLPAAVQALHDPAKTGWNELHHRLAELPFAGVLTESWDDLLEAQVFKLKLDSYDGYQAVQNSRAGETLVGWMSHPERFFLLRLMGSWESPETFLFSVGQLREELRRNELLRKLLTTLFDSRTVLFVGADLAVVEMILQEAFQFEPSRTHYALVPEPMYFSVTRERLSARKMELLAYPNDRGDKIAWFLQDLRDRLPKEVRSGVVQKPDDGVLTHVSLTQIGPFDSLNLSLSPEWNVLLGNNSAGKTTILRALALGFSGDDPKSQAYASPLLKIGAETGRIEVRVGGQLFSVDLRRINDRVYVSSRGLTPLQARRMAVFGFGALRGALVGSVRGPTSGRASWPEVEDVLPLLAGGADPRLDEVSQWIVNTIVHRDDNARHTPERQRAARMLDVYFNILCELTPGVELRLSRLERDTWTVYVHTCDGEVPLRQVSQGTASLMGWVGALLQRMFEIHSSSEAPEREPAVVLVDEIDAHMHPWWQWHVVGVIRKHLPRLQVIATTHSPLVVGGLHRGEAIRLARGTSGEIEATRIDESFEGWRADQILTGPAFDLLGSVSEEGQRRRRRYAELHARTTRTPDEQREYQTLSDWARVAIPTTPETPAGREALELVERALDERHAQHPDRVLENARKLLAELEKP